MYRFSGLSHVVLALLLLLPLCRTQATYSGATVTQCSSLGSNAPTVRLSGSATSGNQSVNPAESTYVATRKRNAVLPALNAWFGQNVGNIYAGPPLDQTADLLPTVGIAVSGGGLRAAIFGAALLNVLDGQNATSVQQGTGGLLQATSYLSGLSGGGLMVSSWLFNNMSRIYDLVLGNNGAQGWLLDIDLYVPGGDNETFGQRAFQNFLWDAYNKKDSAGGILNVSVGDVFGRNLAYHFLTGTTADNFLSNTTADNHAAQLTYSSLLQSPLWQNNSYPFPIIIADAIASNESTPDDPIPTRPGAVYEMTPVEFGSFDPSLAAFWPMTNLGTRARSGTPLNNQCVTGFDNAGLIIGASGDVLAGFNVSDAALWVDPSSPYNQAAKILASTFAASQPDQQQDIVAFPNPFEGLNPGTFENSDQSQLRMVDGGSNGEGIPLAPMVVPARNVDLIIATDAVGSACPECQKTLLTDIQLVNPSNSQPSSLLASNARRRTLGQSVYNLPPMPQTAATFIQQGLVNRTTFFGCDGTPAQLSSTVSSPYPLMAWLPNRSPVVGTSASLYTNDDVVAALNDNIRAIVASVPSSNIDWATCMKCATVERLRGRTGTSRTATCNACFDALCWNGQESSSSSTSASSSGGGASATQGSPSPTSPSRSAAGRPSSSFLLQAIDFVLLLATLL